jgi:hypothetical protein
LVTPHTHKEQITRHTAHTRTVDKVVTYWGRACKKLAFGAVKFRGRPPSSSQEPEVLLPPGADEVSAHALALPPDSQRQAVRAVDALLHQLLAAAPHEAAFAMMHETKDSLNVTTDGLVRGVVTCMVIFLTSSTAAVEAPSLSHEHSSAQKQEVSNGRGAAQCSSTVLAGPTIRENEIKRGWTNKGIFGLWKAHGLSLSACFSTQPRPSSSERGPHFLLPVVSKASVLSYDCLLAEQFRSTRTGNKHIHAWASLRASGLPKFWVR